MTDAVIDDFRVRIMSRQPLRIRGSGSKDFHGGPLAGEVLETAAHVGIVSYEPSELVVTVRCGTPLATLKSALAERRQFLPFEAPEFGPGATVGGVVATGLSGPRRMAVGSLRDFVLGVTLMDGEGRVLKFGGEVMKNVAGYDVSRLMAGSLGTLGLILEVSLKVLPLPFAEASLVFEMPQAKALETMNRWAGQPLPVSATCWAGNRLNVRLSGAEAAVGAARVALGGEGMDAAEAATFWRDLREQEAPFFVEDRGPLWRLAVPPVAGALDLPGQPLLEWGGAQRWLRGDLDLGMVRAAATAAGGHATLFRGADDARRAAGVFAPLSPPLATIHRRLKAAFDPHGVFGPGRLYPGL